jgi:metal-responsive CopG/Arc/MetJ family transcriptional regulator
MSKVPKSEIVTFKVDGALLEAMRGIPNRSEFIRNALMAALDSTCPLCNGTGVLTPRQRTHYNDFVKSHAVVECEDCHETHIVCLVEDESSSKNSRGIQRQA